MPAMSKSTSARRQIVVVDACFDDYSRLLGMAKEQAIRLTITTTGAGALRLAASFPDALWLVCPQLPDMNGLDLLEMLCSLQSKLKAVVVDAQYDLHRERRALQLRAVQYVCKPVRLSWIDQWQGKPVAAKEIEETILRIT